MTGPGTNTYLIGRDEIAVIDPGPDDHEEHLDTVANAGRGRIKWILVTHTHFDHSPGADGLKERTGAEVLGFDERDGFVPDRADRRRPRARRRRKRFQPPGPAHAGPRVEPPLLRARRRAGAVLGRPHHERLHRRHRAARRRHGDLPRVAGPGRRPRRRRQVFPGHGDVIPDAQGQGRRVHDAPPRPRGAIAADARGGAEPVRSSIWSSRVYTDVIPACTRSPSSPSGPICASWPPTAGPGRRPAMSMHLDATWVRRWVGHDRSRGELRADGRKGDRQPAPAHAGRGGRVPAHVGGGGAGAGRRRLPRGRSTPTPRPTGSHSRMVELKAFLARNADYGSGNLLDTFDAEPADPTRPARSARRQVRGDGPARLRHLRQRLPGDGQLVDHPAGPLHRAGQGPLRGDPRRHRPGRRGRRRAGRRSRGRRRRRRVGRLVAAGAARRAPHLARPRRADRGRAGRGARPALGPRPLAAAHPRPAGDGPSHRLAGPGLLASDARPRGGEQGALPRRGRALVGRHLRGRPRRRHRSTPTRRWRSSSAAGPTSSRTRRSSDVVPGVDTERSPRRRRSRACGPTACAACSTSCRCRVIARACCSATTAWSATSRRPTISRPRRTSSSRWSPSTCGSRSPPSSASAPRSKATPKSSTPSGSSAWAARSAVTPSASPAWPTTSTT